MLVSISELRVGDSFKLIDFKLSDAEIFTVKVEKIKKAGDI
jgi:hypothetical protein